MERLKSSPMIRFVNISKSNLCKRKSAGIVMIIIYVLTCVEFWELDKKMRSGEMNDLEKEQT